MTEKPRQVAESIDADSLTYDERGLIPAIAQQHDTGEVLMLAWMTAGTIRESIRSGEVVYWSRRRGRWRKGETSGHVQRLLDIQADCDGDCVLLLVDQVGPACHTGNRNCFFRVIRLNEGLDL